MTLREYIDALQNLEREYEADGYKAEDLTISGYLLGMGTLMDPKDPFGDGMVIHLDWTIRPL